MKLSYPQKYWGGVAVICVVAVCIGFIVHSFMPATPVSRADYYHLKPLYQDFRVKGITKDQRYQTATVTILTSARLTLDEVRPFVQAKMLKHNKSKWDELAYDLRRNLLFDLDIIMLVTAVEIEKGIP